MSTVEITLNTANIIHPAILIEINVVDTRSRIIDNHLQLRQVARGLNNIGRVNQTQYSLQIKILGMHDVRI
jgi:hypothetical protein